MLRAGFGIRLGAAAIDTAAMFVPIMAAAPPDTRPAPRAEMEVVAAMSSVPTVAAPADGGGDAR